MAAWTITGRKHIFNVIFVTVVFSLNVLQSSSNPLSYFGSTEPLYGPNDKVFILNATNIKDKIFKSEKVWFVEFFSSWCGHCINFAPKWKKFAEDLWGWREVVVVAAIDCADDNNTPACREFNIMGYPTLRLFPPRSPPLVEASEREKSKGIMETVNKGTDVHKSESMEKLKRNLIDELAKFYPKLLHFSKLPGVSVNELWQKDEFRFNVKPSFLLIIYESETSYVGQEVALRLSIHDAIKVYRFDKKNSIYSQFQLQGWPAAGYISDDGTSGPVILGNDNIIDTLCKSALSLAKISSESSSPTPQLPLPGLKQDYGGPSEKHNRANTVVASNRDVVSMDDLLHAVRDSLHKEIALVKLIEGQKLEALKLFVDVLNQLFPADRREVKIFLEKLEDWISQKTEIESSDFLAKLDQLETELRPWDIDMNNWDECRGTVAGRRGYTCGLWRLFHALTIVGVQKNSKLKVLNAIHGYVKEFFGCRECKEHFTGMVTRDKILSVDSIMTQALWLWKIHNEVNLRLIGAPSEDPGFPKQRYPNKEQCSECYDGLVNFDEGKVMEYLLKKYSNPQRSSHERKLDEDIIANSRGRRSGVGGPSALSLMSGADPCCVPPAPWLHPLQNGWKAKI
ncbi:unnamed protein product [Allacma fusca]|uniref:Sulfhydryl oxidase n=1 Tax=Allacma fusca TaxID=39272 RepID=A0A8J2KXE4_9HEXA|nr:unnamed protein product [Allacma fusca]